MKDAKQHVSSYILKSDENNNREVHYFENFSPSHTIFVKKLSS